MDERDVIVVHYPTYYEIENFDCLSKDVKKDLNYLLGVFRTTKTGHKYFEFNCITYIDDTKIRIPGGINDDYLLQLMPLANFIDRSKITKDKKRDDNENFKLTKKPKSIIQKKAIEFLKEKKGKQKYLALQTGQGKTYCAINYIQYLNKVAIIILDKELLVNQWIDRLKYFTDLNDENIFVIKGKPSIKKLKKKTKEELLNIKIYIALHQTLLSINNNSKNELSKLFLRLNIGIKVFDEAHCFWKNMFMIDCTTKVESLYLSATPFLADNSENKVYQNSYKNVPIFKSKLDKYIDVYLYEFSSECPQDDSINFFNHRGFDVLKYSVWLFEKRDELIYNIVFHILTLLYKKDLSRRIKSAFLVKKIEHTEIIKEYIEYILESNNISDFTVKTLTGETKDKKEAQNANIIISTDASFSKGADIENLQALVNFVPCSSYGRVNQITGRLRYIKGKRVSIIDLVDTSIEWLINMVEKRLKFYNNCSDNIKKIKGRSE